MIQWFPGHMAKALKEIENKQKIIDLFIIILDARAPISTYNQEFDKIASHKPRLFVITKIDLADANKLKKIEKKLNNENKKVILVNLKKNKFKKQILYLIEKTIKNKIIKDLSKGLIKIRQKAMVIGVPNSGKSTLINLLSNSKKAKVGNMPGITKGQQWIKSNHIQLLDTPGILWPKFKDELIGIKLAIIGSIKTSILPKMILFNDSYKLLTKFYPQKIKILKLTPSLNEEEIYNNLITLCKMKKWKLKNNEPDFKKGQTFFLNYLKNLKGVTFD